jgi:hypothetical protein
MDGTTPACTDPALDGLPPGSAAGPSVGPAVSPEPPAEPPLLRGYGGALVGDVLGMGPWIEDRDFALLASPLGRARRADSRIQLIVDQLAPIRSRAALLSSFEREANPDDPLVRAAYERAWADLAFGVSRMHTRRARIRATMVPFRGRSVRGRG